MRRASQAALVGFICVFAGCAGQAHGGRAETEVRALFASVAANGRAHRFVTICDQEMTGVLRQLDYLVGGNCPKDLAREWAEGVQLTGVGPGTRVVVSGNIATIFDGPVPDRVVRVGGSWGLAEVPRNKRFDEPDEARKTTEAIDELLRSHHLPSVQALSERQ